MRSTISSVVAAFIRPPPYSGSTKVCIPEAFESPSAQSDTLVLHFATRQSTKPYSKNKKWPDKHLVHMAALPYFICIHMCMFFSCIFNFLSLPTPVFLWKHMQQIFKAKWPTLLMLRGRLAAISRKRCEITPCGRLYAWQANHQPIWTAQQGPAMWWSSW